MRTRATCAHSRTTSPRFSAWCLLVNFCSTFGVPSVYSQAITRVVAASGGKLNWDVRKDVSSWNCVTVAGAGANFSVKFGFKFSSPVDLADLVQIFGAKLASLDVANQPKLKGGSFDAWGCRGITGKFPGSISLREILQVTSPSWPIASRCRCLTPIGARASLVSFSRIFLSRTSPQSAHKSFREKSSGDIAVLQHCPNIENFLCSDTGITGKLLSDRSFADQSAHESFREKS